MLKKSLVIIFVFLVLFSSCSSDDDENEIPVNKLLSIGVYEWIGMYQLFSDEREEVIIIDFRTYEERLETGSINDAILIDYKGEGIAEVKTRLGELDKTTTYFLISHDGLDSFKSLGVMMKLEFDEVYNLQGGALSIKELGYNLEDI